MVFPPTPSSHYIIEKVYMIFVEIVNRSQVWWCGVWSVVVSAKKVVGQQSCSSLAAANSIGKDERKGGSAGVSFQQNWRNLYCLNHKVQPYLYVCNLFVLKSKIVSLFKANVAGCMSQ